MRGRKGIRGVCGGAVCRQHGRPLSTCPGRRLLALGSGHPVSSDGSQKKPIQCDNACRCLCHSTRGNGNRKIRNLGKKPRWFLQGTSQDKPGTPTCAYATPARVTFKRDWRVEVTLGPNCRLIFKWISSRILLLSGEVDFASPQNSEDT